MALDSVRNTYETWSVSLLVRAMSISFILEPTVASMTPYTHCCCDLWSAVLPAVLLHYSRPSRTAPPASPASPMAASRALCRAEKHEVLQ